MITKVCLTCGDEYTARKEKRKYCCRECADIGRRKPRPECKWCGKTITRRLDVVYCSSECQKKGLRQNYIDKAKRGEYKLVKEKDCPICGAVFIGMNKTCSFDCGEQLRQINHSNTIKEKYGVENISQIDYVKEKKAEHGFFYETDEGREITRELNRKRKEDRIEKECKLCGEVFRVPNCSKSRVYCSKTCYFKDDNQISGKELEVKSILEDNNITFKQQFVLEGYHYDFIVGDSILLEVDGVYWHGKDKSYDELNESQRYARKNDKRKNLIAKDNGYKIVRIWGDEISNQNIINKLNISSDGKN